MGDSVNTSTAPVKREIYEPTYAYYAVAPFIGVLLSLIIFREIPGVMFFIALAIMILGTWLINRDC